MRPAHQLAVTIIPVLVVVMWHMVFIAWGCDSLYADKELHTTPFLTADHYPIKDPVLAKCAGGVHLWKYSFLNVFVAVFALLTYFFFPAGGEGARARAMLLTVLHLGLSAWGMLIWSDTSSACKNVIASHYGEMYEFGQVCIWHNAVLFILFLTHEAFADELGVDLTVVAIFNKETNPNYDYYESNPDPSMQYVAAPQPLPAEGGNEIYASEPPPGVMSPTSTTKTPSRALHDSPSLDLYQGEASSGSGIPSSPQ